MRFIDLRQLDLPPGWTTRAKNAYEAVRDAAPEDRREAFKKHQDVWTDLKESLKALSHGKCWYCESEADRSDKAVDHFRPKGNVKNANPPHAGYWWLAFDWKNYRLSCLFCNSLRHGRNTTGAKTTVGGKQDEFPLEDESRRAQTERDSLKRESPLLLDPANSRDVKLIIYAEDGSPGASTQDKTAIEYVRAMKSAQTYHLHHPDIVTIRRKRIKEVRNWVDEGDEHLKSFDQSNEPEDEENARRRLEDILGAMHVRNPHSAAVIHMLVALSEWSPTAKAALEQRL